MRPLVFSCLACAFALAAPGPAAEGKADPARLRREAAALAAKAEATSRALVRLAERRAAFEAVASEAERRLGALAVEEGAAAATAASAAEDKARAFALLSLLDRADPRAVYDGLAFTSLARAAGDREASASADRDRAARARAAAADERRRLANADREIEAQRAAMETLLMERERTRRSLIAEADRAERRARAAAARARSLAELARRSARQEAPRVTPASARRAPVRAPVETPFGATLAGRRSEGIAFAVRPGTQIVAPAAARVAYAGPFRTFGQVLILEAERDYVLVLTGLGASYAKVGDRVLAGEPLGEASRAASSAAVYFEVRRQGAPINPARWLEGRT